MLEGKRLLITGVLTKGSIAYTVAERAQQDGAQILLTGFGRTRRMTERAAARLPEPPDVLELDVNNPADFEALAGEIRDRWGGLDGALHAIAFAPGDALGGNFMSAPPESAFAISSKFSTSDVVRSISAMTCSSALRCSLLSGLRSATSAVVRITASGVRSSCEASAVNRDTFLNAASSRPIISFNVADRRSSSSPVCGKARRSERFSAVIKRAVSVMRSTGASARRLMK